MLIKSNELKKLNILKSVLLFVSLIALILYIVYMYNINFFRLTRPCMMTAITEFICVFSCFIFCLLSCTLPLKVDGKFLRKYDTILTIILTVELIASFNSFASSIRFRFFEYFFDFFLMPIIFLFSAFFASILYFHLTGRGRSFIGISALLFTLSSIYFIAYYCIYKKYYIDAYERVSALLVVLVYLIYHLAFSNLLAGFCFPILERNKTI